MCCLFTCCGWMIDLIQRLWTFTMSCCISSAVCCALVTASMSGIALGYNYSLAEYIDLKETNVSVYLKRGIFDDEIGDDMEWRRSGHLPVAGHIGDNNLRTGAPEEESTSVRSGRRLDDSIYESDDRNRFEGALMKLTAKAPAAAASVDTGTTLNEDEVLAKYSMGSLDQLKAIQTLINMRKSDDARHRIIKGETKSTEIVIDERYMPQISVNPADLAPGRRFMSMNGPGIQTSPSESARWAVPDQSINEPSKWRLPKLPPEIFTRGALGEYDERPTYPMPVTPRAGPVRPTRPKASTRPRPTLTTLTIPVIVKSEPTYPKSIDEEMDTFKDKLLLDKFDAPSFNEENFMKNMKGPTRDDEDYEEAIKGVPSRRKKRTVDTDDSNNKRIIRNAETKKFEIPDDAINESNSFLIMLRKRLIDFFTTDRNTNSESKVTIMSDKNIISTVAPNLNVTSTSSIFLKLLNATIF